MESQSLKGAGRIGRGLLATVALFVLGFWTFFALTFACCSSPSLTERLREPMIWCMVLAIPTPLAALPPLSRRLRRTRARWGLAVSVVAAGLVSVELARQLDPREGGGVFWMLVLTVVPLGVCAVYVLLRVVLARSERA